MVYGAPGRSFSPCGFAGGDEAVDVAEGVLDVFAVVHLVHIVDELRPSAGVKG